MSAPRKEYVHGYRSVLIRGDVKDQLINFLRRAGFPYESQTERCLVSAAVSLALRDAQTQQLLLAEFESASVMDIKVIRAGRGADGAQGSPFTKGTDEAKASFCTSTKEI